MGSRNSFLKTRELDSLKRKGLTAILVARLFFLGKARGDTSGEVGGQASKGIRWMPWHQEAMKDVVSCEKPRGAANKRRSGDVRMGKPTWSYVHVSWAEYIGSVKLTGGSETSQYPQE